MPDLDSTDLKILDILAADARTRISDIARQVHKSRTAVEARVARMETQGPILGYTTRLAAPPNNVPSHTAFMQFTHIRPNVCAQVWACIKERPGVIEAFSLFGDVDMLVRYDHTTIGDVVEFKESVLATGLVKSVTIMPVLRQWPEQ
jgi:Lrp/AsnC family leucine-responsive transcriptional regulator